MASMIEVAHAGVDYIDVAMEPLSWGMVHPDVISVQAMLKDAGFLVKDIDMNAYMEESTANTDSVLIAMEAKVGLVSLCARICSV